MSGAEPGWDPAGLDLARAVARTLGQATSGGRSGAPAPRSRRRGGGRRQPDGAGRGSGARPDDRDPQRLQAAIERLVAERGWTTDVAVAGAISRWEQVVGPEIAQHCRAVGYRDAELTVTTDSTAWATQLRLLAGTIVRRLNEELGDGTVRRLRVAGPSPPRSTTGRRRVRDGRGPRDTYG